MTYLYLAVEVIIKLNITSYFTTTMIPGLVLPLILLLSLINFIPKKLFLVVLAFDAIFFFYFFDQFILNRLHR